MSKMRLLMSKQHRQLVYVVYHVINILNIRHNLLHVL